MIAAMMGLGLIADGMPGDTSPGAITINYHDGELRAKRA